VVSAFDVPPGRGRRIGAQPFPAFKVPDGVQEGDRVWLEAVGHPVTNAAFTAAGLPSGSPSRRKHFESWAQATQRVSVGTGGAAGKGASWGDAARALTVLLLTRGPGIGSTMTERIEALREALDTTAAGGLDPDLEQAAGEALTRVTRAVENWRRKNGVVPVDWVEREGSTVTPPPF